MNTTVAAESLEQAVNRLARTFRELLSGSQGAQEVICSLQFAEAEALAEVLEAGLHRDVAARFMHRWALTEPDWDDENGDVIRRWLAIDVGAAPPN